VTDPRIKTVELRLRELIDLEDYDSMREYGAAQEEYDEDMRSAASSIVAALGRLEQSRAERAIAYINACLGTEGKHAALECVRDILTAPPPAQEESGLKTADEAIREVQEATAGHFGLKPGRTHHAESERLLDEAERELDEAQSACDASRETTHSGPLHAIRLANAIDALIRERRLALRWK